MSLFALDRPEVKSALAAALSQYTGKKYQPDDLVYEINNGQATESDDNSYDDIFNVN